MDLAGLSLTLRQPTDDDLRRLAGCDPVTPYRDLLRRPELAAARDWHRVHETVEVPDGDLAAVADHVLGFDVLRHVGIGITADAERAEVGATVVQRLPRRGPGLLAPCRIVEVVETDELVGFLYAALPGHPVAGEEAFAARRRDDGTVVCRVTSRSRPEGGIAARVRPVLHAAQAVAARGYLAGMAAAARGG